MLREGRGRGCERGRSVDVLLAGRLLVNDSSLTDESRGKGDVGGVVCVLLLLLLRRRGRKGGVGGIEVRERLRLMLKRLTRSGEGRIFSLHGRERGGSRRSEVGRIGSDLSPALGSESGEQLGDTILLRRVDGSSGRVEGGAGHERRSRDRKGSAGGDFVGRSRLSVEMGRALVKDGRIGGDLARLRVLDAVRG
jgi:hypothetical protein